MTEPKKPPKGEDTSQSQPPEVTAMTATISNSDATLKANAAISTSKLSEDELNAKAAVILGKIMAMHPDRLRSVTSATPKEKVHGVAAQATVTKAPDYISLDDEEYRDAEGIVHGPGPMQSSNDMVPASAAPSQPDGFETKAGLVAICRRSYAPYDVYVGIKKAQSKMYYQDKENRREVRDWAIAAHREVVRQSKEGYKALDKVLSDSKAKAEMYDQDEEKRRQLKEWAASRHREVIRQSKELYQAFAKILSDKKVAFEERQEVKKMRDWDQAFPKLRDMRTAEGLSTPAEMYVPIRGFRGLPSPTTTASAVHMSPPTHATGQADLPHIKPSAMTSIGRPAKRELDEASKDMGSGVPNKRAKM